MVGAKCKTCGAREHNHVCSAARIGALELPSRDPPLVLGPGEGSQPLAAHRPADRIIEGLKQAVEHARGERDDVRVTVVSLYAPAGECEWCDRRRTAEAARIKAWRAKKRGGS